MFVVIIDKKVWCKPFNSFHSISCNIFLDAFNVHIRHQQRNRKWESVKEGGGHEFILRGTTSCWTFKGIQASIFSHSICNEGNARFTTVPFLPLDGLFMAKNITQLTLRVFLKSSVSEFNKFEPRLKSAKNRFHLSAGLNHEKLNTILNGTNHIWAAA